MTTTWIFLRHGESLANADGTLAGWRDVGLTALGEAEARLAAQLLAPVPFDHVVSSDLLRAKETARLVLAGVASITGRPTPPVTIDPRMRERTCGSWEGCSREWLREQGHMATLMSWSGTPPGDGESHQALARRIFGALEPHLDRRVLFVSHGGVIRVVMGLLDDVSDEEIGGSTVGNAEMVVRAIEREEWGRAYRRAMGTTTV